MPFRRLNIVATLVSGCLLLPYSACAELLEQCLLEQFKQAKDSTTIAELKQRCGVSDESAEQSTPLLVDDSEITLSEGGALGKRIIHEIQTERDPYVLTPHLMNYILPATYTSHVNFEPYRQFGVNVDELKHSEVKFQLSIKVPLFQKNLLMKYDAIYFGITIKSFWQLYASDVSAPFRETNYHPELFYIAPLPWHPFDGNSGFVFGVEHESNGQSRSLSRSWNRIYGGFLYEKGDFALAIKPWWRIKEDMKASPDSAQGDDNPDIEDYMGHFQLTSAYKWHDFQFNLIGRENFATNKGALELGFTFPISGRLRGYLQYFNGYGESLIDYNFNQQRIGLGIALTDFL